MTSTTDNPFEDIFGKKPTISTISDINEKFVPLMRMHFLRLSPSYNLAIKLLAEKKSLDDPKVIEQIIYLYEAPAHQMKKRKHYNKTQERFSDKQRVEVMNVFNQVIKTAKKFGDLNREYKEAEKISPFSHVTTPYINYPDVGLIGVWNERGEEHSRFLEDLARFTTWAQDENAYEPALVLLVPLRTTKKTITACITQYIEEFRDPEENKAHIEKVPLYGKRIHPDAILKKLKVLAGRFMYPDLALWELALKIDISDVYTGMHKHGKSGLTTVQKERLSVISSRLLHQAMTLAENAAVGLFPLTQKNLIPNYDAVKTRERILKIWPDLKS